MRRILAVLVLAAVAVPLPALAGGPSAPRSHASAQTIAQRKQARWARIEERIKTMRAVALANRLGLDSATALKLNALMQTYDAKRADLRATLAQAMRTLKTAGRQRSPDQQAVDDAVEAVLDTQSKIAALQEQEARELMAGLTPRQKARLVLFFRDFPREIRRLLRKAERLRPPPPKPAKTAGP